MKKVTHTSSRKWTFGGIAGYLLVMPSIVWIALFLVAPTGLMIALSFFTQSPRGFSFVFTTQNYNTIITYSDILLITIRLALIITVILFFLGYPLAYFMAMKLRSERAKTLLLLLLLIPFWIDWTIRTVAWFPILGENGLVNVGLTSLGLIRAPIKELFFSQTALILVWIQAYILFMVTPIYLSMIKIDPVLVQAAETLGANRWRAFYQVVFRLSLPGVVIGCIFVFVFAIADYATPTLIGGGIQTIGLTINQLINFVQWPQAAALSSVVIAVVVAFMYIMLKIVDVKRMLF